MINYICGWLRNWRNPAVSLWTLVDSQSCVSHKARLNRFVKVILFQRPVDLELLKSPDEFGGKNVILFDVRLPERRVA